MKIEITIKHPDAFGDAIDEAVRSSLADLPLDEEVRGHVFDARRDAVWKKLAKWVTYQEYVTIEFDTDAGTATVAVRT